MTLTEIIDLVSKFKLDGPFKGLVNLSVDSYIVAKDGYVHSGNGLKYWGLTARLHTQVIDTGKNGDILLFETFPFPPINQEEVLMAIHQVVKKTVLHEVEENMYIDHKRPWDPHNPHNPTCPT